MCFICLLAYELYNILLLPILETAKNNLDTLQVNLSYIQLVVGLLLSLLALYIANEQIKLSKDQNSLTEWIFKVTQIRDEINMINDIILETTDDYNKCYGELQTMTITNSKRDIT